MAAVSLRFSIAVLLALMIYWLFKKGPFLNRQHLRLYAVSGLSIFPNMPLVYLAVDYIPSGLVSVLFGLSPFAMALLSGPILGERLLNRHQYVSLTLALTGLFLVFAEQIQLNEKAYLGLLLMLGSVLLFSSSNLLVRREVERLNQQGSAPDAFQQVCGSMTLALPGLIVCWLLTANGKPPDISVVSMAAILYSAVMASLVGFVAYFMVLSRLDMALVSLLPLITPILAMLLGVGLAGEQLSHVALLGYGIILLSLAWYQNLPAYLTRWLRRSFKH